MEDDTPTNFREDEEKKEEVQPSYQAPTVSDVDEEEDEEEEVKIPEVRIFNDKFIYCPHCNHKAFERYDWFNEHMRNKHKDISTIEATISNFMERIKAIKEKKAKAKKK